MANPVNATFQIGKNGISDNLIKDISDSLESHELIKITVLKTLETPVDTVMREIATSLGADAVGSVGNKFIIYRRSGKENFEHLNLD